MLRINNVKTNATRMWLLIGAISLVFAASLFGHALAQAAQQDHSMHAQEMKAPQTAQEHKDRAAEYEKKAAEYRKDIAAHRKMLTDYSKTVAQAPKTTIENAYIKKMRLHCEKYIKAAEALAREADEMAKFHTMRAKEMEGK